MGQTKASESPALDITVSGVTRLSSDLVEIRYALKNKGSVDLYLPYFQTSGSTQITTCSLLHRINDEAWVNIGHSYDIASYKPKILKPGEALTLTELVSDPAVATLAGPEVPRRRVSLAVQGWHKISVGYYSGAAAWQQRINAMKAQQDSRNLLRMPQLEVAYSERFDIPPAAK
jgi:hypothetical protein